MPNIFILESPVLADLKHPVNACYKWVFAFDGCAINAGLPPYIALEFSDNRPMMPGDTFTIATYDFIVDASADVVA